MRVRILNNIKLTQEEWTFYKYIDSYTGFEILYMRKKGVLDLKRIVAVLKNKKIDVAKKKEYIYTLPIAEVKQDKMWERYAAIHILPYVFVGC